MRLAPVPINRVPPVDFAQGKHWDQITLASSKSVVMETRKDGVMKRLLLSLLFSLMAFAPAQAQERFITVASTTSTEQSGLFDHLLPMFRQQLGMAVVIVRV
jgi:hypothetical protein